jgi:hypothetical protein
LFNSSGGGGVFFFEGGGEKEKYPGGERKNWGHEKDQKKGKKIWGEGVPELSSKGRNNFPDDLGFYPQALVSFKKYMPPPLPYFKVNICPLPLPHFASIFFAYL